jgi:hypothetical protein
VRKVAADFPTKVTVQNLFGLACPGGRFVATFDGAPFRPDGVHFDVYAGTGSDLLAGQILPLWEQLGHIQEVQGGAVVRGPLPTHFAPA